MTTRRAKLQFALDSDINAAEVLRDFTANGGHGLDNAVDVLYIAAQEPEVEEDTRTRRQKLQDILDAVPQEVVAERLRDFTAAGGSGIENAIAALS